MSDNTSRSPSRLFGKVSLQDKIDFARHLSIVIKAGVPVYEGLNIVKEQTHSKTLQRIIGRVMVDVNNGRFLSDSLEHFTHFFGDFFIHIIRVGESSGTLSQNLIYLADELKRAKVLRSEVRSAMIYPMVIMFAAVGVTGFLAFFVFPKLIPVFTGLGVELPFATRFLITVIDVVRKYGLVILGGIAVVVFGIRLVTRKVYVFRYGLHALMLWIPVLSSLMVSLNAANFTRVLGLLLKSGIKIVEALTITSSTLENLVYRRALMRFTDGIRRGEQLVTFLSKEKHLFPPLLSGMVGVGENTGNLEDNLIYLSEYYTEEVSGRLKNLTSLLEPLLLMIMGVVVGFVAVSIILPIYQVTSTVK